MFNLPSFRSNKRNKMDMYDALDRFFNDFRTPALSSLSESDDWSFLPKLDASETKTEYCLEFELPGIGKENVDIKISENDLIVQGKKESSKKEEDKDKNFFARERFYGSFQRSLTLPYDADKENIDAIFKDGVLTVKIPKKEVANEKKVAIK
ncbi:MAG: Hsp20/alpha crystallin family protein [Rickettsiaceae bacterium]|nr:Hsp20/alpha crystallin family protein [Rickettsiaceae bacterium]